MGAFDTSFDNVIPLGSQPIPIRPAMADAGAYPIEALSPRLQAAARAIVDKVQLPDSIACQSVLAVASLAVQAHTDVELPTGERVPTSEFFITVAASGDRKSSADKLALRPVRHREHEMHVEFARLDADFQADHAAYTAAKKKAMTGKRGRVEIKQALEACGEAPIAPAQPVYICDEPTIEGLYRLLSEAMPSIGLFSDEGGQFLGGYAMSADNRGKAGAALSKLWDAGPIKRVRGTDGITVMYGRRVSLHLMIQPKMARQLFGDDDLKDQGLLSRMLLSQPTTLRGQRMWRNATANSADDLEKYEQRVLGLLRLPPPMNAETRELKPGLLTLSDDAKEMFVAFHDAVEAELGKGGQFEAITGFAAKLPEHSVRIAAIMAFFEDRRTTEISDKALAGGIRIAKFHADEALRLFGHGSIDIETERAAELIDWIRQKNLTVVGLRALRRDGPGRKVAAPELKRIVAMLVDLKHLTPVVGGADVQLPSGKTEFNREAFTVISETEPAQ